MRTRWVEFTTVALTVLVVVALAGAGWWLVGRSIWGSKAEAWGPLGIGLQHRCGGATRAGMRYGNNGSPQGSCCLSGSSNVVPKNTNGKPLTIQQAKDTAEEYVASLDHSDLRVDEVIEFSQGYYAIVRENDTGLGAMELLVDKATGAVGPEYGPNMVWNAKYGMMGGSASDRMDIPAAEALKIAQRWLDTYRPGQTPEPEPDVFHGYYTIHTLKNGQISGMLSVQGSTGQVWYHTWHGAFVQRTGAEKK